MPMVSDRSHKGGYGIDSVCREMLEDIQLLLLTYGIASHIHMQDRSLLGWRHIYRLVVTGAQFKERFSKFISCCKDKQVVGYRSHHLSYPMAAWKALEYSGSLLPGPFRLNQRSSISLCIDKSARKSSGSRWSHYG